MSRRVRNLFDGFVLNRPLAEPIWNDLLGRESTTWWREEDLLGTEPDGNLVCRFQAISVDGLVLLTDARKTAENRAEEENAVSFIERPMHEYLKLRLKQRQSQGRALDVGPGAGLLTLDLARTHAECEGVDLNPRAAVVAGFNLRLNDVDNCRIS